MTRPFALPKAERINSKKQIDRLFNGGGSRAMSAFPLRMVYMVSTKEPESREPMAQMMVSVPKRHFKHAVQRNHIKRQVREAYRRNKHIVWTHLDTETPQIVSMCFIWTSDRMATSQEVEDRVQSLLQRLAERISVDNK